MRYKVIRKWPDGKWHTEGRGLTARKAHNLQDRLYEEVIGVKPDDILVVEDITIWQLLDRLIDQAPKS